VYDDLMNIQSSSPLTPNGIQQATKLGQHLKALKQRVSPKAPLFDHVFVSPTIRTKTTASILCEHIDFDKTKMKERAELIELTHGEWDGKLRSEHHTPEVLAQMQSLGWDWKSPTGESLNDVEKRMLQFIQDDVLPLESAHEPVNILAVSHSIAIRTLLKSLLKCEARLIRRHGLDNTGLVEFVRYPEGWSLQRWNDSSHLGNTYSW
jgi:broad specificity phosphatase PhoE